MAADNRELEQRVNVGAMRRRQRVMRAVNVPMRAVLGLPFATPLGANLMLISYTGRKTGKAYRQPVSYARDGETLLTPGGGRWTLNLGDGRPVRIRLRGRDVAARPELVTDAAEVERLLGVIGRENPRAAKFVPIPRRPDGHLDPEILDVALLRGFCIVRWHLGQDISCFDGRDRAEQAEIRREQEAGELHDLTEDDPFPPTRYES